jgi:hypothetical protein
VGFNLRYSVKELIALTYVLVDTPRKAASLVTYCFRCDATLGGGGDRYGGGGGSRYDDRGRSPPRYERRGSPRY